MQINDKALEIFTEYFVKNYPGPDTIIHDPKWHAPRIFRVALHALTSATPPDVAKIARSLEALAEHLSDQPLTHADSTDLATIRQAATALRLSAGGGVPEGWYCSAGEHHTLLYTLRQDGWRKGKPVMVNDVTIRIENANGSQTPIEQIVRLIMDAVNASPAVEAGHVE